MTPRLVWPTLLTVGAVAEFRSLRRRDGATLSEVTRDAFRVHTPTGRAVFLGALVAANAVFAPHILRRAARAADHLAELVDDALAITFDTEETP